MKRGETEAWMQRDLSEAKENQRKDTGACAGWNVKGECAFSWIWEEKAVVLVGTIPCQTPSTLP